MAAIWPWPRRCFIAKPRRARLDARCRPGCDSRKGGELSLPMSASSTSPNPETSLEHRSEDMSLDDLPSSDRPRPVESAVQRVDRAVSNPYKITRAEELRLQLADEIVRGALAPGSPLDETDIARRFSVSRTPVREALRQLGG